MLNWLKLTNQLLFFTYYHQPTIPTLQTFSSIKYLLNKMLTEKNQTREFVWFEREYKINLGEYGRVLDHIYSISSIDQIKIKLYQLSISIQLMTTIFPILA